MPFTRRSAILASGMGLLAPALAQARAPAAAKRDPIEKHLAALDRLVIDILKQTGVPGLSIAVVNPDRVVYLKGFGVRRAGAVERVDADTVFQLASLSKPLATTVVAGLVGDGAVSWDDPIVRSLPDFAMSDPWVAREVTLRDMFCHRSGLPDHAGDLVEDIGYGRDEILHRLRYVKPSSSFRSHYAYTNFGFTAAAVAAAQASGKGWEDICDERLYKPLDMASASSRYADFAARPNRAYGHVRRGDAWVVGDQRDPGAQSPAGGASASVRDMAAWMRLQLGRGALDGREIVKPAALDDTHRPQIATGPAADPTRGGPTFYGLGWDIDYNGPARLRWSHSGAFSLGASTCAYIMPVEQFGIVVLSNSAPVGAPEAICRSFLDLVLLGKVERDWLNLFSGIFAQMAEPTYGRDSDYSKPPAGAAAAAPFSAYAGDYRNDLYGPIAIAEAQDGLRMSLGRAPKVYALSHYSGDTFAFQPPGENAFGPSPVKFAMKDGQASSVQIDYFNGDGQGVFTRA